MVRTLVAMGSLRAFPCLFVHCLEQRAFLLGQLLGAAHWPQTPSQPCQTTNGQMVWAIPTSLNKSNSKGIIGIEFVFPRSTKKVDFGVKVVHAKVWGFTPKFGGSRMFHACFTRFHAPPLASGTCSQLLCQNALITKCTFSPILMTLCSHKHGQMHWMWQSGV